RSRPARPRPPHPGRSDAHRRHARLAQATPPVEATAPGVNPSVVGSTRRPRLAHGSPTWAHVASVSPSGIGHPTTTRGPDTRGASQASRRAVVYTVPLSLNLPRSVLPKRALSPLVCSSRKIDAYSVLAGVRPL